MEGVLTTFLPCPCSQPQRQFPSTMILKPKSTIFPLHLTSSVRGSRDGSCHSRTGMICLSNNSRVSKNSVPFADNDEKEDDDEEQDEVDNSSSDWESEFIGEVDRKKQKPLKNQNSKVLQENEMMDWCVRAEFEDESSGNGIDDLKAIVGMIENGMFEERKEKNMEAFIEKLSQISGSSNRKKEVNLNRSIVDSQTAEEVLEVVSETMMAVSKGMSPSPLSPLNIATAIHRIAKKMETVSMIQTRRLGFARQREMSMLVGIAMSVLPECSGQGISNISWALSKIGGELLYSSEMDRVAEVASTKVTEFNSQNIANLAGAFASMLHSAPDLFSNLSKTTSGIINTFQDSLL